MRPYRPGKQQIAAGRDIRAQKYLGLHEHRTKRDGLAKASQRPQAGAQTILSDVRLRGGHRFLSDVNAAITGKSNPLARQICPITDI